MLSKCTVISCYIYILFSPLLLIFFILLINYTIFYYILLLCMYEYHCALYVFHHNFLATLYKFLTLLKKINIIFNSAWPNYRKSFIKTKTTFAKLKFAGLCNRRSLSGGLQAVTSVICSYCSDLQASGVSLQGPWPSGTLIIMLGLLQRCSTEPNASWNL
jgi:hypothetical protein